MEIENYKEVKEYINNSLVIENGIVLAQLTETDLMRLIASFKPKNLSLSGVSESYLKENAYKWYLKGFKDAENTESQPIPLEQTIKDAETNFYMVWDCYKANSR